MGLFFILVMIVIGFIIYFMEKSYDVLIINGKPITLYLIYIFIIIYDIYGFLMTFFYVPFYITFLTILKILFLVLLLLLKNKKQLNLFFVLLNILIVFLMGLGIFGEFVFLMYNNISSLIFLNITNYIPSIKRYYDEKI